MKHFLATLCFYLKLEISFVDCFKYIYYRDVEKQAKYFRIVPKKFPIFKMPPTIQEDAYFKFKSQYQYHLTNNIF